jgi:hypothetical protein
MITKMTEIGVILGLWLVSQITPQAESVFGMLLEYGVSFALLGLIALIFYREWKSSDVYNKTRDKALEELIQNNTEAMGNTKKAIDDMRAEQKNFRQELRNIHGLVKDNTSLIREWRKSD